MYLGDDCEDVNLGYVRIHTKLNESIYIKLKGIPPYLLYYSPYYRKPPLGFTSQWHGCRIMPWYHQANQKGWWCWTKFGEAVEMIDSFHEQNIKNNNWFSRIVSFKSIIWLYHVLILHWVNYNLSPTQISWFHVISRTKRRFSFSLLSIHPNIINALDIQYNSLSRESMFVRWTLRLATLLLTFNLSQTLHHCSSDLKALFIRSFSLVKCAMANGDRLEKRSPKKDTSAICRLNRVMF